ncbi:rhodanese-like domain-containing protein [Mucilaginibacter sp. CSA2-8R]|uniref:rhodanese-like domain-containing protein n=1 Tax=Mucilaginibacter sp. CSA2-8R TaxID=3141542 RepID=UPI00315DFF8B
MKTTAHGLIWALAVCLFATLTTQAQTSPGKLSGLGKNVIWTPADLVEPAELAASINKPGVTQPVIFNIGAVEDIEGAVHVGAANNAENRKKLNKLAERLPKNRTVVIYCGCCPFGKCPNVAPAFTDLKTLGLTQVKVLDLPVNLKTNWIAKGYPLATVK